MKLTYNLFIWIICKAVSHVASTTQGASVNKDTFEVWPGETFATGVSGGEFGVGGHAAKVRYACLVRCLQHASCLSVSVHDTEPYRCLWSRYAFYAPQLGESAPGWALYTRNKGIGIYERGSRYSMDKSEAAEFCVSLGGRLSSEAEVRQLMEMGKTKCQWGLYTLKP